ncbi:MAG TPA: sialidase family protein [Gaiellaceae bacterium]
MKLKIFIAVVAAVVLAVGVSAAQAASVQNIANITRDDNGDNELDIAVNPTNPDNMIAGWNDYGVGNSCGVGWTTDGGKTWHTDWLRGMTPAGGNPTYDYGAGDPSVGFLDDGTAVFTCNAWSVKKPTAIFVTTSKDGGATWTPVQQVASADTKAGNLDHPMMTIDHFGNRALIAYTTWSGHQANSWALVSDGTATHWSGPYRIAADYKSNAPDVFDVSLAGAPDGTIYATSGIWQHVNEWSEQAVVVSQLRPGEAAFTRSVKVRDLVPAPMTLPGESWRTSMQASIGVDSNGTVYELTGDDVTGHLHMYLAKSTDHGASFPTQLQLTSGSHDEVMPWMSVTPGGRVDTIYYDYDESTGLMNVDYGQVAPGGSTLSTTVVQSGIDGDSQPPRGAGGTPFMGDYIGIDSTAGLVALAWTGNGPLSQDAWAATLKP